MLEYICNTKKKIKAKKSLHEFNLLNKLVYQTSKDIGSIYFNYIF